MTKRRRIAVTIGVLVALQLAAIAIYLAVRRSREPALPSAPAMTVTRASGSPVALGWPSDKPRIVHFWGTWCRPCTKELPGLLAFARELSGIEVVAIAVEDDWTDIAAFFGGAIPPEIVVETDGAAHRGLGVTTLPDSYLVDRAGRVVERVHGAHDWSLPSAREHVLDRLR